MPADWDTGAIDEPPMESTSGQDDGGSNDICVVGADRGAGLDPQRLIRAVRTVLAAHGRRARALSIALVSDEEMTALHGRYLDQHTPTDVLTFDLADEPGGLIEGEIVISVDTAARECRRRGHPLSDEVMLYAVHGTLHLLGYDDQTEAEARRMHARENALLTELGVGAVYGEIGE